MSEATFRAVVAVVLVGALALAVVTTASVFHLWPPTSTSSPMPLPTATAATTSTVSPIPPPPFGRIGVTGVGSITRGGRSPGTLVLSLPESSRAAIPDAAGSFRLTLTDADGRSTVAFVGAPVVEAPGSLGAHAGFVGSSVLGPNVLEVTIRGSDDRNLELITITGLGISASSDAAVGPVHATLGSFTGSLAAGVAHPLPAPGTVVAQH
jgi:hypothetical protein